MAKFGVCMVSTYYYPFIGGAERQTERLADWLTQQDIHVLIITRALPDVPTHERRNGTEIWRVKTLPGKMPSALTFIIMACLVMFHQRREFTIIHSHQIFSPTTIGWLGSVLLGKPLIVNLHGGGKLGDLGRLLRNPRVGKARLNLIAKRAAAFISISKEISRELQAAGIQESQIHLLTNSVDADRYHPVTAELKRELRAQLELPLDVPLVVYVGRLVDGKGLEILLEAWAALEAMAHLIIIGTGDLETELRQQVERESPNSVHIVGFKNNVVDYLQACDIWTLPSFSEGLPLSLLEAMACAMPIITTPVGGIPEIIQDGVNGWLIPPRNVEALTNCLSQTLTLDDSVLQRGQAARQTILDRYSIEPVSQAYYQLYQTVLGGA